MASELAQRWWMFAKEEGWYADDPDQNCAILYVTLSVDQAEHFNLTHQVMQDRLYTTAKARNISSVNDFGKVYEWLIDEMEQGLGIKFKVITAAVPTPRSKAGGFDIISRMIGFSKCHVVRTDDGSVVQIEKAVK